MQMRQAIWYLFIPAASVILILSGWTINRVTPESAPVARGAAYAGVRGCVACHGDPENPRVDANDTACDDVNTMSWHPDYQVECTDVMAYFETVRLRRTLGERTRFSIDNPLIAGEQLARKYHCFQCHGHLGQGGFANNKSLKGYVPGYFGADFRALTRNADPDSVSQWIMHGADWTLLEKPVTGRIAKFFFDRQAISMPSYKSLATEEIEILTHYVIALNRAGPMTAQMVRAYGEQSQSTSAHVTLQKGRPVRDPKSVGEGKRQRPVQH